MPVPEGVQSGAHYPWHINPELADPIVLINFRMPTDLDDKTGIYELQSDQSATFSGLYRVYQIEHSFDNGMYKNFLKLVRFNNQGVKISTPMREYRYLYPYEEAVPFHKLIMKRF